MGTSGSFKPLHFFKLIYAKSSRFFKLIDRHLNVATRMNDALARRVCTIRWHDNLQGISPLKKHTHWVTYVGFKLIPNQIVSQCLCMTGGAKFTIDIAPILETNKHKVILAFEICLKATCSSMHLIGALACNICSSIDVAPAWLQREVVALTGTKGYMSLHLL